MRDHSASPHRDPFASLKGQYPVTMEIGFALSLILVVLAFRLPYAPDRSFEMTVAEQETVMLEEIEQTRHAEPPPPPPRVQIPIPIANDLLLQEEAILFESELLAGESVSFLPPPPAPPPPIEAPVSEEGEIFVIVEQMPEIIGGIDRLRQFVVYPEVARIAGIEGTVVVQFVVEPNGIPSSPNILRSAGVALDGAAVDAVMKLRFTPGLQRNVPVRVRFAVPVRFTLQTRSGFDKR